MEERFVKGASCDMADEPNTVSLVFQVVAILTTCAILFLLVKSASNQPKPVEKHSLILPLDPQKMREHQSTPTVVRTGLTIKSFREFDFITNRFIFEGTVWFEFDPALTSLETLSNFKFQNADILSISKVRSHVVGKYILASYDVVVKSSNELDYRLFPVDDHIISFIMINNIVSPYDLIFESDTQKLNANIDTDSYGWRKYYNAVATGYVQENLDRQNASFVIEKPAVQYSLYYRRYGLKYSFILLLPMIVFIIVMLTSFSYDPRKNFSSIMVANGASLSGLIAFRFVIENMSPKIGYFMVSDYFFLLFLFLAATIFLLSIFSQNYSLMTKKIIIVFAHATLLVGFSVITWYVYSYAFYITEIV